MLDRLHALADDVFPEVVRLRRAIHRRPELAFEEHETAALIARTLRALGLDVTEGIATTGVVAHVEGARPGPTVALRADIDALGTRLKFLNVFAIPLILTALVLATVLLRRGRRRSAA